MKKNGFTMVELIAIIVIMACILLIVLPSINNTIKNSEEKEKQEALNSIYMAAENYLMANYDDYKIDNAGDITYIYITDLISNDYMSIDTTNPNNDSTFSNKDVVKVTRNDDGTFSYELDYLKTLIETLLEQYSPDNTTGLLRDSINENIYYYKGTNEEVANNFLWYGGHQWRVIEFDNESKTLTLITQQPLTTIHVSSTVWMTEESYDSSYINTWLNDYFWNSLDSSIQNNVLDTTFNVGIYTNINEIKTTKKVGLLDTNQYKRAGSSDSFLDIKDKWWLANRYADSSICNVDADGTIYNNGVNQIFGIRPIIKISNLTITGGNGTLDDSYHTVIKSTNTSNVQVGEYINIAYNGSDKACGNDNICTFRIVSKNSNSIKIILNGLLLNTSAWAEDANDNITINDTIYTPLKTFVGNIDGKYITTGTFGVGIYDKTSSYIVPQSPTITSNVGLPTVGEIFSGNDIDLSNPADGIKIFVDVNTIENPTISSYYWTMNRYDNNSIRYVYHDNQLHYNFPTTFRGVRPTVYLKNNLTFTGGDGTPQNPYTLD